MLRRTFTLSLLTLATVSNGARADAILALQWRDTGTQELTILPGDTAAGGERTLDIVLTIDTRWVGYAATVALPNGSPLHFNGAEGWAGVPIQGVTWTSFDRPVLLDVDDPLWNGDLDAYQQAYNLVTFMVPPFGPPWVPPGDYVVGSVLLDTSAAAGVATIESLFVPRLDGLIIDDGTGTAVYSDDATFLNATLGTAQLFVVPEPSSLSLAALGLLTVAAARRRRRPFQGSVGTHGLDAS